ncbi:alanine racemase [Isoptericola sp. BMS4]|uniref:alanine racemase n=1 Tax=Isoptericola sp. BMS4 TaxID=2527875 RepID=UPI001422399E|nr:alanine racemase [Isoptericola sp. BMS4]
MEHDGTTDACRIDRTALAALADERTGWQHKALPPGLRGLTVAEVRERRPHLSELPTPLLTLSRAALDHNVRVMADWCASRGLSLAPHGKTTMAPALWADQVAAGAWAITVANHSQLAVARAFGVSRVMVANSLISPLALRALADDLAADPGLRVLVWADDVATARLMHEALDAHVTGGARRPVDVLVERGGAGGRTGARSLAAALEVAEAVAASPHLRLAGVAGYEGALAHDSDRAGRDVVRSYLRDLAEVHAQIEARDLYETAEPVVSAGGSAFFDLVDEVLSPLTTSGARVVLRSGAYQVHDDGFYRHVSPLGDEPRTDGPVLRAAMHGWVRVSSRPEPGLALFDAGKRDLPFDEGLPRVQLRRPRAAGEEPVVLHGLTVTALNDQHGFCRFDADGGAEPLRIGDELRLGLSHPCTAMDKWSLVPVVEDADAADPVVVDLVRTFF